MKKKPKATDNKTTKPVQPYVPTEVDRNAARAWVKRRAKIPPAVRLTVRHDPDGIAVKTNYPDEAAGQVHLMNALSITDGEAYGRIVNDLLNLAGDDNGKISERRTNELMALVREIGPKDGTEALLAAQMVAIHSATIRAARMLMRANMLNQADSASNSLNKLARTFTTQVETLKKYRSDGQQTIKVTHVAVNEGGKAIVGNIHTRGGAPAKNAHQPHEPCRVDERSPALLGNQQAFGEALPGSGGEGLERMPVPRR